MQASYKEKLEYIGVEVEEALKRFMGNDELYLQLLLRLPEDSNYALFLKAVERGDQETALRAVHTLKGICGNLSIKPLYKTFGELTKLLRKGEFEQVAVRKPEVERLWNETISVLKEWKF